MAFAEETLILPWRADIHFKDWEREAIESAVDEWYRWTRGKVLFNINFDFDPENFNEYNDDEVIFRTNSDDSLIQQCREEFNIKRITGVYYDRTIYIAEDQFTISLLLKNRAFHQAGYFLGLGNFAIAVKDEALESFIMLKNTVIHELGHYWGLKHTEGKSVMAAKDRSAEKLTRIDAEEFCRVHKTTMDEFDFED